MFFPYLPRSIFTQINVYLRPSSPHALSVFYREGNTVPEVDWTPDILGHTPWWVEFFCARAEGVPKKANRRVVMAFVFRMVRSPHDYMYHRSAGMLTLALRKMNKYYIAHQRL